MNITRQYSSRMRTTRLPTVGVSVVSTRCQDGGPRVLGPRVNKFEQVFSDDHQMSVAGGWVGIEDPCHMSGGGGGWVGTVRSVRVTWNPSCGNIINIII